MGRKIAYRNKSPTGWWIATYIIRAERDGKKLTARSRCLAWENTIILKAANREAAYAKAMKLGAADESRFDGGRWKFMGLRDLGPIYDEFSDGAEISWSEYRMTLAGLKRRVSRKAELSIFDDTPAIGDRND